MAAHTTAAITAGTAHTASAGSHPPSASASGTADPAASVAPSVKAIENVPVSAPDCDGYLARISIGSSACAAAIDTPAMSAPTTSAAVVPMPRSAAPAAVPSASATSSRSIGNRRASRGASGANAPMQRTGSVVISPAAVADSPRSARTSDTSGGKLASTVRRLIASRTKERNVAAPARAGEAITTRSVPGRWSSPRCAGPPRSAPRSPAAPAAARGGRAPPTCGWRARTG